MYEQELKRCSDELYDYITLAGSDAIPFVNPARHGSTVTTHAGRVLMDNNLYVNFALPDSCMPMHGDDAYQMYFAPAMLSMSRALYNLCRGRVVNSLPLEQREVCGVLAHNYPTGYSSALNVRDYMGNSPDIIGMGLQIGPQRYSVIDAQSRRDHTMITVDRPLDEEVHRGILVYGSTQSFEPDMGGWAVVTAPCAETAGEIVPGRVPFQVMHRYDALHASTLYMFQILAGILIPQPTTTSYYSRHAH